MSTQPGNPYWCQNHDRPIMIMSQGEWDQARADGWLTDEHIVQRLTDVANFALGNGAELGFGPDGFLVSLVSDGMRLEGGVTLQVYSNDRPPPHVHVLLRGQPKVTLRIRLDNGEPMDAPPSIRSRDMRRFTELVLENSETLIGWWQKRVA